MITNRRAEINTLSTLFFNYLLTFWVNCVDNLIKDVNKYIIRFLRHKF